MCRWSSWKKARVQPGDAGGKRTATLKFKVKDSAEAGTYKVTLQVKGSAGISAKAKILVTEPK